MKREDTPKEKEITVRQMAVMLGIVMQNAYTIVWAGKLPARKKDGRWLVDRAAVEQRARERERIREAALARNAERTAGGVHAS